ncbi:hypothetical protein CERSUDRAFT_110202 [Gelatoporia subvermispora B]|uniref:DUF6534 domain-containing protein n=1 Tax=Ceriporiopsis subvermispora (strain B) TaxID=914234 RepID=M2PXL3_CERS8|nr:hypothetical protein CERSUDRAFT_110202 [Gelatoporia subvermispora B]
MSRPSDLAEMMTPLLGPVMLGTVFSSIFFGITVLQTYQYYDQYWDDPLGLKLFVAVLGILDAGQLVTLVYTNWWYLIENYGHPIPGIVASLQIEIMTTTTITSLVQCFFARRVWACDEPQEYDDRYFGGECVTINVHQSFDFLLHLRSYSRLHNGLWDFLTFLKGSIISQSKNKQVLFLLTSSATCRTRLETLVSVTRLSAASIACGATADLISISLCHFYHTNRTGVQNTDKVLNVLIIYAINTGLLTTIVAICTVTLEVSLLGTQWDTVPYFSLSKCYVNSVLATLNARTKIREMPWGLSTTEAVGVLSSSSSGIRNRECREGSDMTAFQVLNITGKKHCEDSSCGRRV